MGILMTGDGLHPSSRGKRVRFSGGKKSVIDGSFAETKELVAGFWIWQVKSMDKAGEWARRCPDPRPRRLHLSAIPFPNVNVSKSRGLDGCIAALPLNE